MVEIGNAEVGDQSFVRRKGSHLRHSLAGTLGEHTPDGEGGGPGAVDSSSGPGCKDKGPRTSHEGGSPAARVGRADVSSAL